MARLIILLAALLLTIGVSACSDAAAYPADSASASSSGSAVAPPAPTAAATALAAEPALRAEPTSNGDGKPDAGEPEAAPTTITLNQDSVTVEGAGVTVEGTVVTINAAGTYRLHGVLSDGQVVVDSRDDGKVTLLLSGVDLSCSSSAPIYVANADKTIITLAAGTLNTISDGESYSSAEVGSQGPNGTIFSHDDLTINGEGALVVRANCNNGIVSKDDLKVTGGNITVNAVNDGLKGRNSIAVSAGTIVINAGGDGLRADNDEEATEGYIAIAGGVLTIVATQDGIHAESSLQISGGEIALTTGGGSANSSDRPERGMRRPGAATETDGASAKGLKAGTAIIIEGGSITVDSSDDALHSNGSVTIHDGVLLLASGDDGIHADATLEVNGGSLSITKSYEGIESAVITLNDGNVHITASDDGINVAGGADGSSLGQRPGQNDFVASADHHLYIHGGYIFVDATGDGIDTNGSCEMTGGTVLVNGPTESMNGALDYLGEFRITGGLLVAVGSVGMAQAPSTSSTQYSVMLRFSSPAAGGTLFRIEAENGGEIVTFVPTKAYQAIVISSPLLTNGGSYSLSIGGRSAGSNTDGLYSAGAYSEGTQLGTFTITSIVTGGREGGGPPRPGTRP